MRISDETKIMRKDDFEKYIDLENFQVYATKNEETIYINPHATVIVVKAIDDMRVIHTISENNPEENKNFIKYFNCFNEIHAICKAVAKLFLDKSDDGFYELKHIDGNMRNDDIENLMWQLRSERIHQYWQKKNTTTDEN